MSNEQPKTQEELQEDFEESHDYGPCPTCLRGIPDLKRWDATNTRIISITYFAPNLPIRFRSNKLTAREFLREYLAGGPKPVKDIITNAPVKYLSLYLTRSQLGIISERIDGVMHWRLPKG